MISRRVSDIGATDKRAEKSASAQIKATEQLIAQLRDPVLADAKQAEDSQDYPKAFSLYKKATEIDPPHPAGYAGMDRIRGILHDRAKSIYIDAVLAESYSDFETAKKKYQECKDVAPKDDVYYERAERKLATFLQASEKRRHSNERIADSRKRLRSLSLGLPLRTRGLRPVDADKGFSSLADGFGGPTRGPKLRRPRVRA